MTYDVRLEIHSTTDEDAELEVGGGERIHPDGSRTPLSRVAGTNNVDGPHAVWLDHSCDEWTIAEGDDPTVVATEVLMFALRLAEKALALFEVATRAAGKD